MVNDLDIQKAISKLLEQKLGALPTGTLDIFGKPDYTKMILDLPDRRRVHIKVGIMEP